MEKLTVEDRIMGRTEPLPKTDLQLKAFTAETKYKVNVIGKDNTSVMTGSMLKNMLPLSYRDLIHNGEIVIEYNNMRIERIVEVTEQVECTSEQVTNQVTNQVTEQVAPKPKRKRTK